MAQEHDRTGVRPWYVYIVRARSGTLYTGISVDPGRRLEEHRRTRRGAKFFRTSPPERIVFLERCADRSAASTREREIKRMSRRDKLRMIGAAGGPDPSEPRRSDC